MAAGGTYRIEDEEFPAPTTTWEAQILGPKLNGLPSINSYYMHTWTWPSGGLESCYMERLINLWQSQDASGQLTALETDPYDADGAIESYGTVAYDDFIIKEVYPITRGLPHYDNPRVVFEVLVSSEVP